jgi:hypothetical protein
VEHSDVRESLIDIPLKAIIGTARIGEVVATIETTCVGEQLPDCDLQGVSISPISECGKIFDNWVVELDLTSLDMLEN